VGELVKPAELDAAARVVTAVYSGMCTGIYSGAGVGA